MKELSIFIDESGDFGSYEPHSPFYIITMVFHEQKHPIVEAIEKLDQERCVSKASILASQITSLKFSKLA